MKVYLAGPMRGIPEFNFPAFRRNAKLLRAADIQVVSPHELDEEAGYFWEGFRGDEDLTSYNFDIAERLLEDIRVIAQDVDAVVVMQGWDESSGARAEASFAWGIGKPVYQLIEDSGRAEGFMPYLVPLNKGRLDAAPSFPAIFFQEEGAFDASVA